jgi:uncharacterized protein (TIGR02246 family)
MRLNQVVLAATFSGIACSHQGAPSVFRVDLVAEGKAIREVDARWRQAMQAHDAAGEAAVYADDGVEYRAHLEPIVGPRSLEEWERKSFAENPKLNVDWSTETIQIAQSGELAIQTGQFHVTGLGASPEWEDKGRLVTVWKKVNGEWRVAHAMVSTTMPDPLEQKKR